MQQNTNIGAKTHKKINKKTKQQKKQQKTQTTAARVRGTARRRNTTERVVACRHQATAHRLAVRSGEAEEGGGLERVRTGAVEKSRYDLEGGGEAPMRGGV